MGPSVLGTGAQDMSGRGPYSGLCGVFTSERLVEILRPLVAIRVTSTRSIHTWDRAEARCLTPPQRGDGTPYCRS